MAEFHLDVTLDFACQAFRARDPQEMAAYSQTSYDPATCLFRVPFLGQEYLVKYPEGAVTYAGKGEEVPLVFQVLIIHYLTGPKGTPLENRWISFKELPDGEIYNEVFKKSALNLLVDVFGPEPDKLVAAARTLGGEELNLGDRSVRIPAFPLVPLALVIWEGDDEFPPSGNILFDGAAPNYLPTKDYAMLCTFLVPQLKRIAATL